MSEQNTSTAMIATTEPTTNSTTRIKGSVSLTKAPQRGQEFAAHAGERVRPAQIVQSTRGPL